MADSRFDIVVEYLGCKADYERFAQSDPWKSLEAWLDRERAGAQATLLTTGDILEVREAQAFIRLLDRVKAFPAEAIAILTGKPVSAEEENDNAR